MSNRGVLEALRRRRIFHWLLVYAAGAWASAEATGFLVDNYGLPRTLLDVVLFLLLVSLFVLLVLVWYHGERGPQPVGRTEGGLLAALAAVGLAGSLWIASGDARPGPLAAVEPVVADLGERSIAVLPFRSSVEDASLGWLDRGIAELVSTHLAQLGDLKVVSGQRIFDLLSQLGAAEDGPVPEALEHRLIRVSGARSIVRGSVFGQGGDLTIAATLADAASGEIQASATARGADVFRLVDEVATSLRAQLSRAGSPAGQLASTRVLTTPDIEAFRAYQQGREAHLRFRYGDAVRHFQQAVELDSAFALAHFRLALALSALGRSSEATMHARAARANLEAASERDRLFVEGIGQFADDTTAAITTFRELVGKYPDDKDARIFFASLLAQRRGAGDPEARRLLTQTVRLDPAYAAGYNMLAYFHLDVGDLEAADSLVERYVELEPEEPNPWDSKGEIRELSGRHEEAREAYRQALRVQPDFRFSLNHLVRSYLTEDDPVGARRELSTYRASPLAEVRIRALALEGDTHLWRGEMDEGLADFEAAEREAVVAGRPDLRAWRLRDIVQTRLALGEFAAAREAAETIRQFEPLDGWWITVLYDSLLTVGDLEAMTLWKPRVEAQLSANPLTRDQVPLISRLIEMWIAHGRGEHATVLTLVADLPPIWQTGALSAWPVFRSMLDLGQTDALLDALERYRNPNVFTRGPRFFPLRMRWAQYFEARAHEAVGDTTAAVAVYQALVDGMGAGLERIPWLSDAPDRLQALRSRSAPSPESESESIP